MDSLISRQAAIDALQKAYVDTQEGFDKAAVKINVGLTKALHMIQDLPSVQRKTGRWIATKEWGGRNYSCSCCKFSFIVDTCMLEPMWNYCPNCGSDMKGDQDVNAEP